MYSSRDEASVFIFGLLSGLAAGCLFAAFVDRGWEKNSSPRGTPSTARRLVSGSGKRGGPKEVSNVSNLVFELMPAIKRNDRIRVLYNFTGYPSAPESSVEKQIRVLASETDGTYEGCLEFMKRDREKDCGGDSIGGQS